MKKTHALYLTCILVAFSFLSTFGQGFVQVNKNQGGQQFSITSDQVLEIQLPSTPSTGYGWYLRNSNNELIQQVDGIVEQVGNWEFISANPKLSIGAAGQQIIRFTGKAAGTVNLNFVYIRPWENTAPLDQFSVSVKSEGAYTGTYRAPAEVTPVEVPLAKTAVLPAKFSWLDEKKLSPVKNQASCGSCWAFAACGQFESAIMRYDNVVRDLSEQWLVNCDKEFDGCGGGMHPGDMFEKYGAVYEADATYKGKDGTCAASYAYHEKIIDFKEIATVPTVEQMKQAIQTYGPLWAGIVAGSNFSAYKSGVFSKTDPGELDHAILLVGWDDATQTWLLRNSWGASWGESGYMKIKYNTSQVGAQATYIVYKNSVTGINEEQAFSAIATLYPNPIADEKLTISLSHFDNTASPLTITINDVQGRVVFKQDTKQDTKLEVGTQAFSKGMYFVNVSSGTHSANYKIVK